MAAAEAACAAVVEIEHRKLRPRDTTPMLPVLTHSPCTRFSEWKAGDRQPATDTEVVVIAFCMVDSHTAIAD